jgi:hypothetical protein
VRNNHNDATASTNPPIVHTFVLIIVVPPSVLVFHLLFSTLYR